MRKAKYRHNRMFSDCWLLVELGWGVKAKYRALANTRMILCNVAVVEAWHYAFVNLITAQKANLNICKLKSILGGWIIPGMNTDYDNII